MSTVGVKPIAVADGEKITPAESKTHKIEFVGDSITCGYGVDDEVKEHHFSTTTEDVTKAYAYKTAQKLNADYSMVSISGYGIISGYTGNGQKVPQQTLPQYYTKLGFSYNKFADSVAPDSVEWDFENYKPEVIVINLGTNDNSYVGGKADRKEEYVNEYMNFVKTVREKNPDAEIFCVLGLMGTELYTAIEGMVFDYSRETGDEKIHSFKLPVQDAANGYAADWHPVEKNHEIAAQAMADEIAKVMGW
ncbi:MAG: SGNH/GDSL hydrolase family protein [Oscillospiraceae bacterium]|nr:SGNH/GDSL hydrolase family protein [Oscillospiraceae bacterium]